MFLQKCRFRLLHENTKKQSRIKNDQFFGFCWRFIDFLLLKSLKAQKQAWKTKKIFDGMQRMSSEELDDWTSRGSKWQTENWSDIQNMTTERTNLLLRFLNPLTPKSNFELSFPNSPRTIHDCFEIEIFHRVVLLLQSGKKDSKTSRKTWQK